MTGRMLDRALAIRSFWVLFVGFNMTFFPMHAMGLSGMPRRIATYTEPDWNTTTRSRRSGAFVLATGVLMVLWNCLRSLRGRPRSRPADPWGGNSLEWYTSSPPPPHNFDSLPPIRSERPLYDCAASGRAGRGKDRLVLDKPTATRNLRLALKLAILGVLSSPGR